MSQPPYQMPPQGYGPHQPPGGWGQQPPGGQAPVYAATGSPRVPLFAMLTMGAGLLSLVGALGTWATVSTFGVEVSVTGMETRVWGSQGVLTLLSSIAIVVLAALAGFLPAMKRLFWSMIPAAVLGLVNLIIVFVAMASIGNPSGQTAGLVRASMGWGLILLLIGSIAVVASATIHVIQATKTNRGAVTHPGFGVPGGPHQGQPQGYQGQAAMPGQQPPNGYGPPQSGPGAGGYGQGGYGSSGY